MKVQIASYSCFIVGCIILISYLPTLSHLFLLLLYLFAGKAVYSLYTYYQVCLFLYIVRSDLRRDIAHNYAIALLSLSCPYEWLINMDKIGNIFLPKSRSLIVKQNIYFFLSTLELHLICSPVRKNFSVMSHKDCELCDWSHGWQRQKTRQ